MLTPLNFASTFKLSLKMQLENFKLKRFSSLHDTPRIPLAGKEHRLQKSNESQEWGSGSSGVTGTQEGGLGERTLVVAEGFLEKTQRPQER